MSGKMKLRIWDVQHGACAMLQHTEVAKLAMIDSGHNSDEEWYPSSYIATALGRETVDYLFITNADLDHMSDLDGLWKSGIDVKTLIRSKGISPQALRAIKMKTASGGELGPDIERYLNIHESYNQPTTTPFNEHMGGVQTLTFSNSYPRFRETNDLSLAVFFIFEGFKVLFPGDLERAGWLALLENPDFVRTLDGTDVLIASHHGRQNGYCQEIFEHFEPQCVVFSDKPIDHGTQEGMAGIYARHVSDRGVRLLNGEQRWVLTTRSDGWIHFEADTDGFQVYTEAALG
jgi:beta-lactamase superfamily II metal-dependent hydrolase